MQFVGEHIARRRLWIATAGVGLWIVSATRAADGPTTTGPATQPALRPVVQLTAQPARDLVADKSVVGGILLRELQRQAVLIAARDELGLRTRDMVLREPFTIGGSDGATTVLVESRVRRGKVPTATLVLTHVDGGRQPPDSYPLGDVQVDKPTNRDVRRCTFALTGDPLVDYPRFVAECERASRGAYLDAVRDQDVLRGQVAEPTRWVDGGAVDPRTADWLRHMDVYSQYNAARALHGQVRGDGASFERMSGLVRAYANLAELTENEFSVEWKAYAARSLLYAERLVAHEAGSARSRYVRAYARALASLEAAAADDLVAAAGDRACPVPPWAAAVAALCREDHPAAVRAAVLGPWSQRELAALVRTVVSFDDLPDPMTIDDTRLAITPYPGMSVLLNGSWPTREPRMRGMADGVVDNLPVVVVERLRDAPLPPPAAAAVAAVSTKADEVFDRLAAVRDALRTAATSKTADAAAEPSPAVLANLLQEQAFVAVVRRAQASRYGGGQTYQAAQTARSADAILRRHPWGPYARALVLGYDQQDQTATKTLLAKVDPRDAGGWVREAIAALWLGNDPAEAKLLEARWQLPARLAADTIPHDDEDELTVAALADRATGGDVRRYVDRLRQVAPDNGGVMSAWMRAIPTVDAAHDDRLYDAALAEVRGKFADRVTVVGQMADWCEGRGAFADAVALLEAVDPSDPSPARCRRIGRLCWRLGRPDEAVARLVRGADLAAGGSGDGTDDRATLYREAAADLVDLGRPDAGLAAVDRSAETATGDAWLMRARCHEAAGRPDDAGRCLRQAAAGCDPRWSLEYYLWAKRHDRPDAAEIGRQAAKVSVDNDASRTAQLLLADGDARRAYRVLATAGDRFPTAVANAEAVVVAALASDSLSVGRAAKQLKARWPDDDGFAEAFAGVATGKDAGAATAAFDRWLDRQLDRSDRADCLSLVGRLLVATDRRDLGRRYLAAAVQTTAYERPGYALAWLTLKGIGDDPATLARRPSGRSSTAP